MVIAGSAMARLSLIASFLVQYCSSISSSSVLSKICSSCDTPADGILISSGRVFPDLHDQFVLWIRLHAVQVVSRCVLSSWDVGYKKVELYDIVTSVPQCWGNRLCLKESRHSFIVSEDDDRFRRFPKKMSEFTECKLLCKDFFCVYGQLDLSWVKVFDP